MRPHKLSKYPKIFDNIVPAFSFQYISSDNHAQNFYPFTEMDYSLVYFDVSSNSEILTSVS